jgi:thymidylate kinase
MKGKLIMIDGLDGSGKGVAVNALKEHFEAQKKKVFDLNEYWKQHNNIPEAEELHDSDIIISSEPTFGMVGKVIREEIIKVNSHGRIYSALSTAHAFALDREILYMKLIIPALKKGKIIVQERGVVTSLVYQPVQNEKIDLTTVMTLPGNKLALQYPPDLLIITKVNPAEVIKRIESREKKDQAIFENENFQQTIEGRYESDWLRRLFEQRGSKVVYLDTNPPLTAANTKENAVKIWEEFVKEKA